MKTTKLTILSIISFIGITFTSCGEAEVPQVEEGNNMLQVITRTETSFKNLRKALAITGLEDEVASGNLTVFGPDDASFDQFILSNYGPTATLESIPVADLTATIKGHVVINSFITKGSLTDNQILTTLNGTNLTVHIDNSDPENPIVTFDGPMGDLNDPTDDNGFVFSDWMCSNGYLHVIDKVVEQP